MADFQSAPAFAVATATGSTDSLRAWPQPANLVDRTVAVVAAYPGDPTVSAAYTWNESSTDADDGDTVIKPDAIDVADPGRFDLLVSAGGGGGTGNPLVDTDRDIVASATAADQDPTGATISATPDGAVFVAVNGLLISVGDGVKTSDCYFSADGGTTAKARAAIAAGDILYWMGSVALYQLAATDRIDFIYES